MTQDEQMLLERGRVPSLVVREAFTIYVQDSERPETLDIEVIAEKAEMPFESLESLIYRPEHSRSVDFDIADRVLCACDLSGLWRGRFREYYENVDLAWRKCECPGCETMFQPTHSATGVTGQKYCSKECRMSARHQRIGRTTRTVKAHRGTMTKAKKCRNGHARTPQNTRVRRNGRIECGVCAREANRASYHRRKQAT